MVLRWIISLTVLLCVLPGGLFALIPENIYQCYRPENYALFNRQNRQGMSMDQLIGLLERLEHSGGGSYMSPQRIAASLLHRFRYDGIIDQIVNQDFPYLEPFTFIQPENAKFQMLLRTINLGSANFPEDDFTLEEKCTFHWLLSHSVNETQRSDEDDFCGQSFRRRRSAGGRLKRAPRRRVSSRGGTGSSGSQQVATGGGFVGNVNDQDASKCPLETGVVYSPYGPVAAGTLIAGLAAGLSEQDVTVEDAVGSDTMTMQGLSQDQRSLQINNIWGATLAGDIAQTALHYESSQGSSSQPLVIGPGGVWNSTYCPHEYSLVDRASVTALTNAEIYGGIDGYLLGSQLSDWNHHTGFRLSAVLRQYYSPDGVSYDRRFRACDRLTNFQSDLVDQDTLQTQAVNFAFAYYASDLGKMPTMSQDNLNEGMDALVSAVVQEVNNFAGNSMQDDGPGCQNVPSQGSQPDNPVCDTMADLTVVVDPSQGDSSLQAQRVFLSEMALAMNIGWNKSYMHIVSGVDGSVIVDKWNYTNKAQLACDLQRVPVPSGQLDLVTTLAELNTYYQNQLDQEMSDGASRSNTQILMLLRASSRLDNEDDVTSSLQTLFDTFPDINIFTVTDNRNVFNNVQQNLDKRQFSSDNMFTTESSQQGIRENLVPSVITNMCQTPSRFVYPPCHTDGASYSFNENGHEFTYYVEPGKITYLRLGPEQFLSSQGLTIQFESSYGALQFCQSRSDPMPADGNDDVTCQVTESTSTNQVEFNLGEPCSDDFKNKYCGAIYYSIQQNPAMAQPTYDNLCSDDDCPFPDSIQFTITHNNMRCNSAAAGAASALLLAAAILARQLLL